MGKWSRGTGLVLAGVTLLAILVWLWISGAKADWLVVVADARRVSSFILRYFINLYNTNPALLAIWVVALTWGCGGLAVLAQSVFPSHSQSEK